MAQTTAREEGFRRSFTISLSPEEAEQVWRWKMANGHTSMGTAARELILIATSSTPSEGILMAARLQAFAEIKTWATREVAIMMEDIRKRLMETIRHSGGQQ